MKVLLSLTVALFCNHFTFAGDYIVGNGMFHIYSGCAPISLSNILSQDGEAYNISKIGGKEPLVFCGPFSYESSDKIELLEKIAETGRKANCFETEINRDNKAVNFKLLPNSKKVIEVQYSQRTYTLEGHATFEEEPAKKSIVRHICVFDPSHLEAPYTKIEGFLSRE